MDVPPDEAVYHLYCPLEPPDAFKVRLADPQLEALEVLGAVGIAFINKPTSLVNTVVARSPFILQRYRPVPKLVVVFTDNTAVVTFE
jgi:hypothetical protein